MSQVSDQAYFLFQLGLGKCLADICDRGLIRGTKYIIKRICNKIVSFWESDQNQITQDQKTISTAEKIEHWERQKEIKKNLCTLNKELNEFIQDIKKLDYTKDQEKYIKYLKIWTDEIHYYFTGQLNTPAFTPVIRVEFEQIQTMAAEAGELIQELREVHCILQEDLQFRANYGAKLIDTKRDGNCLFSALGYVIGESHHKLRKKVCKFLKKHTKDFKDFVHDKSFEKYVHDMEQDGTYADHLIVSTFANIYNQTILILQPDGTITSISPSSGETKKYIVIGSIKYNDDQVTGEEVNHYVGLQPIDQSEFGKILRSKISPINKGTVHEEGQCYVHWAQTDTNDSILIKPYDNIIQPDPDFLHHKYDIMGDFDNT